MTNNNAIFDLIEKEFIDVLLQWKELPEKPDPDHLIAEATQVLLKATPENIKKTARHFLNTEPDRKWGRRFSQFPTIPEIREAVQRFETQKTDSYAPWKASSLHTQDWSESRMAEADGLVANFLLKKPQRDEDIIVPLWNFCREKRRHPTDLEMAHICARAKVFSKNMEKIDKKTDSLSRILYSMGKSMQQRALRGVRQ